MPAPEPGGRWGILGGAFDPIHLGHLNLAREVRLLRHLDGILLVPTYAPPHRPVHPIASYEDRIEMTRLAIQDQTGMEVSRVEERTGRPSFTIDTVRVLKTVHPGVEFELVMGADQLSQLQTWHRWRDLLDEVLLVVGGRPGVNMPEVSGVKSDRIIVLNTPLVLASSTQVRARITAGANSDELTAMVPAEVAKYIQSRNLYR